MWRIVATQLALILYFLPFVAESQVWLKDRESREGPGFKLGESMLFHPGAAVEGGYDTNALRRDSSVKGAGRLRLSSYVDIATRSRNRRVEDETVDDATPPKADFRFGLAGFYDFFFSGSDAVVDKQNDFGIDSHLDFTLFPTGPYSLFTKFIYVRTMQPYESSEEWHARHTIYPRVGFKVQPGGGTLALTLSYGANFLLYEEDAISENLNKVSQDIRLQTSWKILPKTALISLIRFSPTTYMGNSVNNNSKPIRGQLGVRGLLTNRFGLALFVGYGASFYSRGDDFDGVIANGELMFFPTPFSNIRLGGQRDFVDSLYANYYVKTGGYLKYEQMFNNVFLVSLKSDVFHRDYSTISRAESGGIDEGDRSDVWIGTTLLLEYRILDWLSAMLSGAYQANISDFAYQNQTDDDPPETQSAPVRFHKFEVMAGVRVHY